MAVCHCVADPGQQVVGALESSHEHQRPAETFGDAPAQQFRAKEATADLHGHPASTLTDNGMVYTVRFAGGRGGRTALEHELRRLHIVQKNCRPNHPTTCGKVERFQQTLKKWLRAQADQPTTIADLQTLLDQFVDDYNHRRPHRSLPHRATPATTYTARPKATPASDRDGDTHDRVRHDRIDKSGKITLRHHGNLYPIGIGRTHARTRVIVLVQDLDIRVINAATGELLRELTLDPTKRLPGNRPPTRTNPEMNKPEPTIVGPGYRRCPETSQWSG